MHASAHGQDERIRAADSYDGVGFQYLLIEALSVVN